MHGNAGSKLLSSGNVNHQRISRLTMEYINATPERQTQIDQEVEALISGKVDVLASADHTK
ncbi:MAG: hypothetical protein ABJF50_04805 [Paracoccaceae bacterium]